MPHSQITIEEFAEILDEATVVSRIDTGPMMTTIGFHPMRGAFTVVQSLERFDAVTEFDAFDPKIPVDVDLVAMAWRVMKDMERRMTGSPLA